MIERPHSTETAVNPSEGERLVRTSHHEGSPIGLSDSGSGRILTFTNESLAYTRHVVLDAQDKPGMEVFLSDELKERMRSVGWKAVRNLFEQDIKDLERDPFGERSIDPDKDSEALRRARSVNGASHALETLLGIPIAIKGSGSGKKTYEDPAEQLDKQYLRMRSIQLRSEQAPQELRTVIAPCRMYGVIRVPTHVLDGIQQYHEWLIMERVAGSPLPIIKHKDRSDTEWGSELFAMMMAPEYFDPQEHAGLIAATKRYLEHPLTDNLLYVLDYRTAIPQLKDGSVSALQKALEAAGMDGMTDFAGRNILVSTDANGSKHYTIIDQRAW